MTDLHRRHFLQTTASSLSALALASAARGAADRPSEKIGLAILGLRSRGKDLLRTFSSNADVEIRYLCDPDPGVIPAALKALPAERKREPRVVQNLREVLADKDVDAVVVAMPDHWHALATIWACQAGKHVYVEKPISHDLTEGRRMVEAARHYNRVVQVGTQRRSGEFLRNAASFVQSGKLGKIPFARAWIAGARKSIGKVADSKVPAKVDYNLWLGPAPEHAFNANRFHYNWHWFWDYGTGEIGNNGIHGLDVIRMLLGNLEAPTRVSSSGGKLFYDDDQQTPDTQLATFDFPGCSVVWEHRIWAKTGLRGESFGIELIGEKGTLVVDRKGWRLDGDDKIGGKPTPLEQPHVRSFLDCVKSGKRPTADIEEGHKSTRLCHLGNIAHRVGRSIRFDGASETISGDAEASTLLTRTYRSGFEVPNTIG